MPGVKRIAFDDKPPMDFNGPVDNTAAAIYVFRNRTVVGYVIWREDDHKEMDELAWCGRDENQHPGIS